MKCRRISVYYIPNLSGPLTEVCQTSSRLMELQGLCPMEEGSDKTMGIGFSYSVSDIERELEERGANPINLKTAF